MGYVQSFTYQRCAVRVSLMINKGSFMSSRKLMILFLALVPLLVLDLWSKMWAESHLATPVHPMVLEASNEEGSLLLGEFLEKRLGSKSEATWDELFRTRLLAIPKESVLPDDRSLFSENGPAYRALFVFSREDRSVPPRGLWVNEFQEAYATEKKASPGSSPLEIRSKVLSVLGNPSIADYITQKIPYAESTDSTRYLAESRVFPYPTPRPTLSRESPLNPENLYFVLTHKIEIIPDYLQFSYAENPGAAWGFLGTAPPVFRHVFFTVISFVAVFAIGFMVRRLRDDQTLYLVAFGAMLSGALGNFIDRFRFRYVIDFIDMYIDQSHWPTYNVADIAISIGVGLIIVDLLFLTGGEGVFDEPKEEAEA